MYISLRNKLSSDYKRNLVSDYFFYRIQCRVPLTLFRRKCTRKYEHCQQNNYLHIRLSISDVIVSGRSACQRTNTELDL